jgi:ATP-dependent helicase HrpB
LRLVIDSGLARVLRYHPYRGINTLLIEKISRAAADQRAGRAGRTAPGHCLRLWTAHEQSARPVQQIPEVKRLDLSEVILTLKASGVNDLTTFRWLETPDQRALKRVETLLAGLGAIEDIAAVITALGRRMIAFPVHPRYARMLLAADEYDCVPPMALIAALTQGRDLLMRRQAEVIDERRGDLFGDETESDFLVLMRAWKYAQRNGYDGIKFKTVLSNAEEIENPKLIR